MFKILFSSLKTLGVMFKGEGQGEKNSKQKLNKKFIAECIEGNTEEVKGLLASGADPDSIDRLGNSALKLICIEENLELVKLLIDYGANVNKPNIRDGNTPLVNIIASDHSNSNFFEVNCFDLTANYEVDYEVDKEEGDSVSRLKIAKLLLLNGSLVSPYSLNQSEDNKILAEFFEDKDKVFANKYFSVFTKIINFMLAAEKSQFLTANLFSGATKNSEIKLLYKILKNLPQDSEILIKNKTDELFKITQEQLQQMKQAFQVAVASNFHQIFCIFKDARKTILPKEIWTEIGFFLSSSIWEQDQFEDIVKLGGQSSKAEIIED